MNKHLFGKTVDRLFARGGAVSLAELSQASKLDKLFEDARKEKFGTDRLDWTRESSRAPIDLDAVNSPAPYDYKYEQRRMSELKRKFKVNGLELEASPPKVSESKAETKPEGEKPMLESIGTSAESKVKVNFVTQCDIRW